MAKTGRKGLACKWNTEDGCLRIKGMARDGLTDEQIASKIGINRTTLYEWIKRYPDIANALQEGKAPVDTLVEDALYKAAIGGNITAQIFWLKNRKRLAWRDAWREDIGDDKTITIKLDPSVAKYSK